LGELEGEYEQGRHLMLALGLQGGGRFLRAGDWGKAEGSFRRGTCAIALPDTVASGYSPRAHLLGIAIAPQRAAQVLHDVGGLEALVPAATRLHSDHLVEAVMIAMWRDAEIHGLSTAFFDHGLNLLLHRLKTTDEPKPQLRLEKPLSNRELQIAAEFIDHRLGTDVRVEEIASELKRSPRSFAKALRDATGCAPFEYLTSRRMERAKVLLGSSMTILEIGLAVGYANPAKFAAAFRRLCGCSPSEWRGMSRDG
jgi:AraC family transcriptional regulator